MRCLIVTGGTPPEPQMLDKYLNGSTLVICVDGAADVLDIRGVVPNVLIGDFDSADVKCVERMMERGTRIIRLPEKKNETDTEAAVKLALESGAKDIVILGATGSRIDHMLGNLAMLVKAERAGARCRIIDTYNEICVARGEYNLHGIEGQTVSILPLTGDITVTATNLCYPLNKLFLSVDTARGISNIIHKSPAKLSISGGYALIVKITGEV